MGQGEARRAAEVARHLSQMPVPDGLTPAPRGVQGQGAGRDVNTHAVAVPVGTVEDRGQMLTGCVCRAAVLLI